VDYEPEAGCLTFIKEAAGLETQHLEEIAEAVGMAPVRAAFAAAGTRERRPAARTTQKG
jgi:hypothetical protein